MCIKQPIAQLLCKLTNNMFSFAECTNTALEHESGNCFVIYPTGTCVHLDAADLRNIPSSI